MPADALDTTAWRLLDTGTLAGPMNMALDEALLEIHRRQEALPILRFYRWAVPTLSLGYAQRWTSQDDERARQLGVAAVRRPSGGRAVLHAGELTYSVVGSGRRGLGDSIHESYCLITKALLAGLRLLGVEAEIGMSKGEAWAGAACFQVGTAADLMWQSRKLAGSAQCRRGASFLQHGSLLIDQDLELLGRVLDTPVAMGEAAVTLQEILGRRPGWEELKLVLVSGFRDFFAVDLVPDEPTPEELALAEELRPRARQLPASERPGSPSSQEHANDVPWYTAALLRGAS